MIHYLIIESYFNQNIDLCLYLTKKCMFPLTKPKVIFLCQNRSALRFLPVFEGKLLCRLIQEYSLSENFHCNWAPSKLIDLTWLS